MKNGIIWNLDGSIGYVGSYAVTRNCVDMLAALGIVPTASILKNLQAYAGKALYKNAVIAAPDGIVAAVKAQKSLTKVLKEFTLSADTITAHSDWVNAVNGAAGEREALDKAATEVAALLEKLDLPADTAVISATSTMTQAAEDLKIAWALRVRDDFNQAVRTAVRGTTAQQYVIDNVRGVRGDEKTGSLMTVFDDDDKGIYIPMPGTRRGGGGSNGPRRKFLVPTRIGTTPWAGSWRKMADALESAGVVAADTNFFKRPSLERAVRDLKTYHFQFENGSHMGAYILANLEGFIEKS